VPRDIMNYLLFSLAILASSTIASRPNILLLLTDDQDVELGSLDFMPGLQRQLASRGLTYQHGFVSTPMCCPSRSSLLTGLYVHNHHVYTNNHNCSSSYWINNHEPRTFNTYLHGAGYHTAYYGKYLNKYSGSHVPPGWDDWFGLVRNSRYYNYSVNNNGRVEHHGDDYNRDYLPDLITNKTLRLLSQQRSDSSPFLAVLAYPAPHGPEDSAPQFSNLFHNVSAHRTPAYNLAPNPDKQWILRHTEPMLPVHQTFTDLLMTKRLQTLQSVDQGIEKIVERLTSTGLLDNTFIFFTSDHGYHLGQFGLVKGKAFPYDFDTRVPLFVRGPGLVGGAVRRQPVLNIDLAPTFLSLAGLNVPTHMDGKSILPSFTAAGSKIRDAFLIERGKMSFKRYAAVSSVLQNLSSGRTSHKFKHLQRELASECSKSWRHKQLCGLGVSRVCRKSKFGFYKIVRCRDGSKARKTKCRCSQRKKPRNLSMKKQILTRKIREVPRMAIHTRMWKKSRSTVKVQIKELRAKLNELKQIRKYLRARRPPAARILEVKRYTKSNSWFDYITKPANCVCPGGLGLPSVGKDKLKRLDRLLRKELKVQRLLEPKRDERTSWPRKQDHCMADVKMNCFSHDNNHWTTPPLWTEGSFCACTNSNNNTYWCVRNINVTHNYLYCEYVTGMITYTDIHQDPHQLRNLLYTLKDPELKFMHNQLKKLKNYSAHERYQRRQRRVLNRRSRIADRPRRRKAHWYRRGRNIDIGKCNLES